MPILRPFSSPTLTAPVEGEFWLNAIHVSQREQNHRTKTDERARSYVQDGEPAPSEFQKQAKLKPKSETDASAFPIARHLHPAASTLSDLSTRAKPPNTTLTHWPASKNLRLCCPWNTWPERQLWMLCNCHNNQQRRRVLVAA